MKELEEKNSTRTDGAKPAEAKNADLSEEKNKNDKLYLDAKKEPAEAATEAHRGKQKPYTGRLYNGNTVFITGSIKDARSIEDKTASDTGAVALDTFENMPGTLFADTLATWNGPDWQNGTGTVIICLDNTEQGRTRSAALKEAIQELHIKCITHNICGSYKTPAEAAAADAAQFAHAVHDAQEKAKTAHLPDSLDRFLLQIQTEAYKPNSTGINFLDDLLAGGLIKQTLTLIMAAPGTGKTTLCQQAAEAIAATGKPVVFLNLEMSREQMLAKSISSRLAQKGQDITALKVLQGYTWTAAEKEAITAEIDAYRQTVHGYLKYNPDGIGSDLDKISDYLTATGEKARAAGTPAPAVILDYLHLVSSNRGLDAQELIKQTTTALKRYAMDFDTLAIAIVAVGREAMKKGQLTMSSGRDSSNLEFAADYIITLNYYDIDQGKADAEKDSDLSRLQLEKWRRMILRLPKSRYGQPGRTAKAYFNAAGNYFLSVGGFIPEDAQPFDDPGTTPPKKRI